MTGQSGESHRHHAVAPPSSFASRYAAFIERRARSIVLASVLLTLVSAHFAARLPVFANFSYLLPERSASVQHLRALEKRARMLGTLMVAITDRGLGIPKHLQRKIFKPFFRVPENNQGSVKGFGLGLSYVQRIVEAHAWQLDLVSEVGKGSEFTIRIPLSNVAPAPKLAARREEV